MPACIRRVEFRSDIAGIAVHIAARISSLAQPGEVLMSSTVKDLVSGSGTRSRAAAAPLKGFPTLGGSSQSSRALSARAAQHEQLVEICRGSRRGHL